MPTVHLLDYVAGNIRSLVNAIEKVGYEVAWVKTPEDVKNADVLPAQPRKITIDVSLTHNSLRNSSFPVLATLVTASHSFPRRVSSPP